MSKAKDFNRSSSAQSGFIAVLVAVIITLASPCWSQVSGQPSVTPVVIPNQALGYDYLEVPVDPGSGGSGSVIGTPNDREELNDCQPFPVLSLIGGTLARDPAHPGANSFLLTLSVGITSGYCDLVPAPTGVITYAEVEVTGGEIAQDGSRAMQDLTVQNGTPTQVASLDVPLTKRNADAAGVVGVNLYQPYLYQGLLQVTRWPVTLDPTRSHTVYIWVTHAPSRTAGSAHFDILPAQMQHATPGAAVDLSTTQLVNSYYQDYYPFLYRLLFEDLESALKQGDSGKITAERQKITAMVVDLQVPYSLISASGFNLQQSIVGTPWLLSQDGQYYFALANNQHPQTSIVRGWRSPDVQDVKSDFKAVLQAADAPDGVRYTTGFLVGMGYGITDQVVSLKVLANGALAFVVHPGKSFHEVEETWVDAQKLAACFGPALADPNDWRAAIAGNLSTLSPQDRQVVELVLDGMHDQLTNLQGMDPYDQGYLVGHTVLDVLMLVQGISDLKKAIDAVKEAEIFKKVAVYLTNLKTNLPKLTRLGRSFQDMGATEEEADNMANSFAKKAGVLALIGCFAAGTPVQMADGAQLPIEQVKAGDWVWSRDPSTQVTEPEQVLRTSVHNVGQTVTVALADAATGQVDERLVTTAEHPFYVDGVGFVGAGHLGIGNSIVTRAGPDLKVQSLSTRTYPHGIPVYNFTVEQDHTYFVGTADGGVWVHNDILCDEATANALRAAQKILRTEYPIIGLKPAWGPRAPLEWFNARIRPTYPCMGVISADGRWYLFGWRGGVSGVLPWETPETRSGYVIEQASMDVLAWSQTLDEDGTPLYTFRPNPAYDPPGLPGLTQASHGELQAIVREHALNPDTDPIVLTSTLDPCPVCQQVIPKMAKSYNKTIVIRTREQAWVFPKDPPPDKPFEEIPAARLREAGLY